MAHRFGLDFGNIHPSVPSRLAHQAAKYAESAGKGDEFRHALFAAHWQQGRDISQLATLGELATEVGLDAAALLVAVETGEFLEPVMQDEAEAQWHGLNGVPAFVFANKYLVSGAQPADVLRRIADKVTEQLKA